MRSEEYVKEPPPGDWLELANGGGVMLRDPKRSPPLPDVQYTRRRKQLRDANDSIDP